MAHIWMQRHLPARDDVVIKYMTSSQLFRIIRCLFNRTSKIEFVSVKLNLGNHTIMNNVSDHDDDQGGFEMAVTKIDLKTTMTYREHAITSKSFARKLGIELPFAMYAIAAGESISAEQSTLTRLFEVVDGTLTVRLATETDQEVHAGEMLVVPAHTVHTLVAEQPCQFIQLETK